MNTNIPQNQESPLLAWNAPVRPTPLRTKRWYIGASIVTVLLFLYSILSGSWSFTVVLAIAVVVYLFVHKAEGEAKSISIASEGITFAGEFFPWIDISGFWVLELPGYAQLHITPKSKRKSEIVVSLGNQNVLKIRELLSGFLPEQFDKNEKIFDKIIRVCKL